MSTPPTLRNEAELQLVQLARELAINHFPLEDILKRYEITPEAWDRIRIDPRFRQLVESERATWESAENTHERTKLKAAAMIEEWLPEANARLHDKTESLNHKTELGKLVASIAQMGRGAPAIEGAGGEKFSVTINLGGDSKLEFNKELPPKVIDAEVAQVE